MVQRQPAGGWAAVDPSGRAGAASASGDDDDDGAMLPVVGPAADAGSHDPSPIPTSGTGPASGAAAGGAGQGAPAAPAAAASPGPGPGRGGGGGASNAAAGPAAPANDESETEETDELEDEDEDEDASEDEDEDELEDEDDDEGEDEDEDDEDASWVGWFCALRGNEFFAEVDADYLEDDFNLAGLAQQVPYYDYALDMLLDHPLPSDLVLTEQQSEALENAAERLYGLAHARFVVTARGLQAVMDKYRRCEFGRCPRVLCEGQPVLPVGTSDVPGQSTVKVFCPRCEDCYYPRSDFQCAIDGAFFGTTLPHLLLLTYPQLRPARGGGGGGGAGGSDAGGGGGTAAPSAPSGAAANASAAASASYTPRVFGFKLHPSAYGPDAAARVPTVRARLAALAGVGGSGSGAGGGAAAAAAGAAQQDGVAGSGGGAGGSQLTGQMAMA